jgi:hypothetical protein
MSARGRSILAETNAIFDVEHRAVRVLTEIRDLLLVAGLVVQDSARGLADEIDATTGDRRRLHGAHANNRFSHVHASHQ